MKLGPRIDGSACGLTLRAQIAMIALVIGIHDCLTLLNVNILHCSKFEKVPKFKISERSVFGVWMAKSGPLERTQ